MPEKNPDPVMMIPMSSPDITDAEREAVASVLRTPNLSMGEEIIAFEQTIREYCGVNHAIGVSSGTAGLHLCVRAANIGAEDLVVTTPFSFVASANVLLFERAIPVFVDVDPRTGNMDPSLVNQAVTDLSRGGEPACRWLPRAGVSEQVRLHTQRKLKAILPVDVFGQPADMEPINRTASDHNLAVIEDSCEALGAEYKGVKAGTLGDYGVFAFYPNKQITTGEGAMILTDDDQSADLIRALRNQGRSPGDTWLQHTHLGYNYRLDEMSAALGRVQMARLDEIVDKRKQVADWYTDRLGDIAGIETQQILPSTSRMSWFVYVVRFSDGVERDRIAEALKTRGIPNRPYFVPIHLQPYMVRQFGYRSGDFPVTENLGERSLALPFSGVMTEKQVQVVCSTIEALL
jgi:dTDP-4-amino-4,6-dideoxygalactose transaminase